MNPNQPHEEDELEASLRKLRPAAMPLDVSEVFYQAGYRAAASQQSERIGSRVSQWLIAATIAVVIVAPASYHAGVSKGQLAIESLDPRPETIAAAPHGEDIDIALVSSDEVLEVAEPDSRQPQTSLFALVTEHWFASNPAEQQRQRSMLTVSFPTQHSSDKIDQHWPEAVAVNRYKTYAVVGSVPNESDTLAVSDVMNFAESRGEF